MTKDPKHTCLVPLEKGLVRALLQTRLSPTSVKGLVSYGGGGHGLLTQGPHHNQPAHSGRILETEIAAVIFTHSAPAHWKIE